MSMENHKRMLKILRQALIEIDRLQEATNRKLRTKPKSQRERNTVEHDTTVAVSTLWQFLKEAETGVRVLETDQDEEIPVFSMMNNMLFNQKRFRDAITRIMGIYYGYMSLDNTIQKDPQILILAQIIEAIAVYIKISRHELLLEDEIFSNTIALMKINRVLQLKELKVSQLDAYHDFSVERVSDGSETNIANCLAAGDKTREAQQIGEKRLRKLRRVKADIFNLRTNLENFNLHFINVLYTKLDFALLWKEALDNKNFGYAVECYAEKCTRELADAKKNVDEISVVIEKLSEAENLLLELEKRAMANLPRFLNDVDGLKESFKDILPVLTAMCLLVIGEKYKALIGEDNIRKYREMRLLVPTVPIPEEPKVAPVSRSKLLLKSIKAGERRGPSRATKIADILGFGSNEALRQGLKKRSRRQSCHQDIIDEYDYTFTQTLAMLEKEESTIVQNPRWRKD